MIVRSFDPEDLRNGTELSREHVPGDFDFEGWMKNTDNILIKDEDSIGFITFEYPGVYSAHHFHKSRRGKEALDMSMEFLKYGFDNHPIEVVRGLTKMSLPHARWIARQMGFKSYGVFETLGEPYELFMINRQEFYDHYEKGKNR